MKKVKKKILYTKNNKLSVFIFFMLHIFIINAQQDSNFIIVEYDCIRETVNKIYFIKNKKNFIDMHIDIDNNNDKKNKNALVLYKYDKKSNNIKFFYSYRNNDLYKIDTFDINYKTIILGQYEFSDKHFIGEEIKDKIIRDKHGRIIEFGFPSISKAKKYKKKIQRDIRKKGYYSEAICSPEILWKKYFYFSNVDYNFLINLFKEDNIIEIKNDK